MSINSTVKLTTLNNGLRIITENIPHLETTSVGVWVNVGTRNEQIEFNGVAHFLEHMAFKGTKRRTATKLALDVENVGGFMNAYTSRENINYYVKVLHQDIDLAVDLLSDILQYSLMDEEDFEMEKSVIMQEISMVADTEDDIVFDYYHEKCFPNQSFGKPTLGTVESITNLKVVNVKDYMNKHYGFDQMVVAASGKVDHEYLVKKIESHFTQIKPHAHIDYFPAIYGGGELKVERPLEQVHMILGFPGLPTNHPDHYIMMMLSTIFGAGMSSRLYQSIRENHGLVYNINSQANGYSDAGMFTIYAGTGSDKVNKLLPLLCKEVKDFAKIILDEEIIRAKTKIKAALLMNLESTSDRFENLAYQLVTYGRVIPEQEIIAGIDKVTKQDIERVALQIFRGEPTFTALGHVKNIMGIDDIKNLLR